MRVGRSARRVADARFISTAYNVADVLQQSGNPTYTLGRLLVLIGDRLQSQLSPAAARPLVGSPAPSGAAPRPPAAPLTRSGR
jgi:hypothetical protein